MEFTEFNQFNNETLDEFQKAVEIHRFILVKGMRMQFDEIDRLLASVQDASDIVLLALLRGTFALRSKLKNWVSARDKVRAFLLFRRVDVQSRMRGLLED